MNTHPLVRGAEAAESIIDSSNGRSISYAELRATVSQLQEPLVGANAEGDLAFLYAANTPDCIMLYLASLAAGIPLLLVEPREGNLRRQIQVYTPSLLLLPRSLAVPEGYQEGDPLSGAVSYCCARRRKVGEQATKCHSDLALLLQTSGTTGSPKLVRLTARNVISNATSIVSYLALGPEERSIQSLPMHYSYGLSLINSHLMAGGTVVLTPHSFMMAEFWRDFNANRCTSFAGVPFVYETLHRIGFEPAKQTTLRTMTQAGGGLRRELISHFCDRARSAGIQFFVMYGQTEATARISYVPFERLPEKIGSIGIPIPDTTLRLEHVEGIETEQELVFEGSNVMMGYAESRQELSSGDLLHGTLRTGDLGKVDSDGFYFLTGRLRRFAKIFGHRINLADVEAFVERTHGVEVAAIEGSNVIDLWIVPTADTDPASINRSVAEFLGFIRRSVVVHVIDALPRTPAGKKDYNALSN